MGRSKRALDAAIEEAMTPPTELPPNHTLARVTKINGNNLYTVTFPSSKTALVELQPRFRSTIWIRRGGYVLVDATGLADRENKLDGEIVNIVREEKEWRKMPYWPTEFRKKDMLDEDSEDENNRVGQMPPSDSEDE